MTDSEPPTRFDRFIEASRLTDATVDAFIAGTDRFDPGPTGISVFDQAGPEIDLPAVDDRLQSLFVSRRSERSFDDRPISTALVSQILAAAGAGSDGRHVIPAAGGLDPIATYAFVRRGEEPLDGFVVRHIAHPHRVGRIGTVPPVDTLRRLFGLDCEGTPALLLAFAVDPGPTMAKYGERGGRFLLQQVGHAMQNVGLRLAESQRSRRGRKLHGYVVGGLLDEVATFVGIGHTRAIMVAGYAIGAS